MRGNLGIIDFLTVQGEERGAGRKAPDLEG